MKPFHGKTRRIALETLGCKVNQYESSCLMEVFRSEGYPLVSFKEKADVYVVHSCAVTGKAAYQTRQLLRRARRINPRASVAVLGCDAQLEWDRFVNEHLATHIVGSREKLDVTRWFPAKGTWSDPFVDVSDSRAYEDLPQMTTSCMIGDRSRAFVKVQDGCDAFCSYCIVPWTRGRSRSLPLLAVEEQIDRFQFSNFKEVVLTGIHLGQWGKDFNPPKDIAYLVARLQTKKTSMRFRLSSLEPMEWSPELMKRLSQWENLCPHFHIPLQSGEDSILEAMGRPYRSFEYAEVVQTLHHQFPDAALGADVIVGFPGETDGRFQKTFDFIKALPIAYLHVFPYSPRPGTPAASLPNRPSSAIVKKRAAALRSLSRSKTMEFWMQWIGKPLNVLVEHRLEDGTWKGTSSNYVQMVVRCSSPIQIGTIVRATVQEISSRGPVASVSP